MWRRVPHNGAICGKRRKFSLRSQLQSVADTGHDACVNDTDHDYTSVNDTDHGYNPFHPQRYGPYTRTRSNLSFSLPP